MSESIGKLALALSKAQGAMKGAKKDAKNPHLRSKYADLESCWDACREQLSENEISVIQMPQPVDGKLFLVTTLAHSSGESISGTIPIIYGDSKGLTPMQAMGSALTYARRYGLCCLVGISPEDDDGESAGHHAPPDKALYKSNLALLEQAVLASSTMDEYAAATAQISSVKASLSPDDLELLRALCARQKAAIVGSVEKETGEIKPAAHPQDTTDQYVSAAQLKRLNAMISEHGLNRDHIKLALKSQAGIDSTKDILKADYEDICARLDDLSDFGANLAKEQSKVKPSPSHAAAP